jgi:general secretion pathway protein D
LVEEGRIVVLGGLIQDSVSMKEDKVPVLGDIPWLGNLFRHEIRQQTKTNLMIFIRPYVLRTASAPNGYTQDRYDYLSSVQKESQLHSRTVLPDMPAPILPSINQKSEAPSQSSLKTEQDTKPPTSNTGSGPTNATAPSSSPSP